MLLTKGHLEVVSTDGIEINQAQGGATPLYIGACMAI